MTLDALDRRIINTLQGGFPVCERPFAAVAADLGIDESAAIARIAALCDAGVLSRFGPMFDAEKIGGAVTLAAMRVPTDTFDDVAGVVSSIPEVAHNYARSHELNMWFVVAAETREKVGEVLSDIAARTGLEVFDMPKRDEYFIGLRLEA
jgi:DNA-binding Lrp family transcriptional regulator